MELYPEVEALVTNYPDLKPVARDVQQACDLLIQSFHGGGKLLACGNGGSAADCEHLVGELMKGYLLPRPLPKAKQEALLGTFPDGAYLASHLQAALPAI